MWSYVTEVLTDDPHGYWRLNDADRSNGAPALDWSGRGEHGVYQGSCTAAANANDETGGATLFDGVSGYVQTPLERRYPNAATLELWMRPAALPQYGEASHPLSQGAPYAIQWDHFEPGARGVFRVNLDGEYRDAPMSGVPAGSYSHVVGTWSGYELRLYVNGQMIYSEPASGEINLELLAWRIARHARDSVPGFFAGAIHDVAVYEYALPADRVKTHHDAMLSTVVRPGTISLDGQSDTQVSLSAHMASGGQPPYSYQWERRTNGGPWQELAGQTSLTCTDDTVQSETEYSYRLRQSDSTSQAYSNEITVTTLPGPLFRAQFEDDQVPDELEPWKYESSSQATVAVSDGKLQITSYNGSGDHYAGLLYPTHVDLRGGIVQARVDQFLTASSSAEIMVGFGQGDLHDWDNRTAYMLRINGDPVGIAGDYILDGDGDWGDLHGPVVAPIFVRIRHSSETQTLYFEASTDSVNWVEYDSRLIDPLFQLHRCQVLWMAGTYNPVTQATAELTDLRIYGRPSEPPPEPLTGLTLAGRTLSWNPSAGATAYRVERRRIW